MHTGANLKFSVEEHFKEFRKQKTHSEKRNFASVLLEVAKEFQIDVIVSTLYPIDLGQKFPRLVVSKLRHSTQAALLSMEKIHRHTAFMRSIVSSILLTGHSQ